MADDKEQDPCIRCGYQPEKTDKHCVRCGTPLVNRCSRKKSPLHKGCKKVNRRDAAFCADCGEPTDYGILGLLKQ
ncbi:MAG: hypothetical protein K0Q59_922 [Paenibacillus sp.]|jgi:hypothetical protein|nr:hypothetical protein [Paenibacillus sp.]